MRIASTQYYLFYNALEIYIAGCDGHCHGCHNKELWDYTIGEDYNLFLNKLYNKISLIDSIHEVKIDSLWIMGGEPLLQPANEFLDFIKKIRNTKKSLWLFTRFEPEDVPEYLIEYFDYIKTGEFILNDNHNIEKGVELASSNQHIYSRKEILGLVKNYAM